jgi:hypothetical protein
VPRKLLCVVALLGFLPVPPVLGAEVVLPDCQGGELADVSGTTFLSGDWANCQADNIAIGPNVSLDATADLWVCAPSVRINGPFEVANGAWFAVDNIACALGDSVLNDTGVDWGGDYPEVNNDTCTSNIGAPQDCDQGRDAIRNDDRDGHAGFSFTKLDADGNALPASATDWSCVRDLVTGLTWEVKTHDGGIHDNDNGYRWGGKTALGDGTWGLYYDDWDILVDGSNTEALCGFTDWRVPTLKELRNLVDVGSVPLNDTDYFPNNGAYWTSSPHAHDTGEIAWIVNFQNGWSHGTQRYVTFRVRLVRSGQ